MTEEIADDTQFRILIDRDKCVGHGRCYSLAPEVYDSDDEGFAQLADGDVPDSVERRAQARLGADTCPEGAISLIPL